MLHLIHKECEICIVAGVNLMIHPELTKGFRKANMISEAGRCAVFDAAADGYVRAEGCGVVILKPLEIAKNHGDRIYARKNWKRIMTEKQ